MNKNYQLSIIIPTKNESGNIEKLCNKLQIACDAINYEVIFVDDSTDNTPEIIQNIQNKSENIKLIHRVNGTGLASAVIEGFANAQSEYFCVIDGDLQHDETKIPQMLNLAITQNLNLVIATRYTDEGDSSSFGKFRQFISNFATKMAKYLLPIPISDPMSGFFLIHKSLFLSAFPHLSGIGFKILLDCILSCKIKIKFQEISYIFGKRESGVSKLNFSVIIDYILLLIYHKTRILIPKDYILFAFCGSVGAIAHYIIFYWVFFVMGIAIFYAHIYSALVAIIVNYLLNDKLTFQNKRKIRSISLSMLIFMVICLIGIFISASVTEKIYGFTNFWFLASISGVFIASVWNFVISRIIIWR